jgi:hypothetical protein
MGHQVTLAVLLLGLITGAANAQNVIYVDRQADQWPHDGSDWCHAYVDLYQALAVAGPQTVIRVAGGVYLPDPSARADPRDASFGLVGGVNLEGGYAGCGAGSPDERDVRLHETVLSGDIGVSGSVGDNCYHVVIATNADASAVLDGFTVSGGNANGSHPRDAGAGMYVYGGGPTMRDCTLRDNAAQYGAGMFNDGGAPALTRCTFSDNAAGASGAGMYNIAMPGQPGATVVDCLFADNTAGSAGGAVRNWDSRPTFLDCRFEFNHARYTGGAVANGGQSRPLFSRCRFEWNRNDTLFAGWHAYGGAMNNSEDSQPTLVNCTLWGNRGVAMYPWLSYGGALANSGSAQTTVINCTLLDNYANIASAVYNEGSSHVTISSSIVRNGGDELVNAGTAGASVSYSNVQQFWPGVGNINLDPLLEDLRPSPGSPCINTGDPEGEPLVGDTDLDGHARMLCDRVDMGAFEFGLGDFNCDQSVDLTDFAHWADCMTGPTAGPYDSGCEVFDVEYDQDVDLEDFAAIQPRL